MGYLCYILVLSIVCEPLVKESFNDVTNKAYGVVGDRSEETRRTRECYLGARFLLEYQFEFLSKTAIDKVAKVKSTDVVHRITKHTILVL